MKAPAPPEVCAVKLALRRMSRRTRDARKEWYAVRDFFNKGTDWLAEHGKGEYAVPEAWDIQAVTVEMWACERSLAQWAERWREVRDAREALPVAERWSLADLEKWARAQGDQP